MKTDRLMTFCAGVVVALLIGQAAKQPDIVELLPLQVGRYQMVAALGGSPGKPRPAYYFLDTATGRFTYKDHNFGQLHGEGQQVVSMRNWYPSPPDHKEPLYLGYEIDEPLPKHQPAKDELY